MLTFVLTAAIDSVVLARSSKVKGKINYIHIMYIFLLFLFVTGIWFKSIVGSI